MNRKCNILKGVLRMPYLEYGKIDAATEKRLNDLIHNKSFKSYWRKKRTFDLIVSSALLAVAAIPMGLVAIAIVIDAGLMISGTIFFIMGIRKHRKSGINLLFSILVNTDHHINCHDHDKCGQDSDQPF